jgi:hypothetical protein
MSAENVYFFPSSISGAIVVGVPQLVFAILLIVLKVLAKPKSAILIILSLVSNMFWDLRSL